VVPWRLRFAASGCVLAASLLMGAGAVAVADPGLGGSAPNGDDNSPVGNVTDTVRETVAGATSTLGSGPQLGQQHSTGPTSTPGSGTQPTRPPSTGPTSTLGSGRQPGQQPFTGATSPATGAGGTHTEDQEDAGLVPADPNPVAAVPNVVAPVTGAVAPVTDVVAPVTNVIAPVTDVVAPVTDVVAPVTNVIAPVTDVVAPVTDVVAPVANVIAPGQEIAPGQQGAGAIPLTQTPSDLSSFLLGIAGVTPVEDGSGRIHGPGLGAAASTSWADIPRVPVAGDATRVATLEVITLGRVSALSGMAPVAPAGAFPMGGESFFPHGLDELLLIASLWAMAVVALPGIVGLVVLTAVGVRIGFGRPGTDLHRGLRASRASPVLGAVKRWMSSR
jgi:hypothetical protein